MSWTTLALLMLPLIGHLRTAPLSIPPSCHLSEEALGFSLIAELSCKNDLNLTSPKNLEVKCYPAARRHFLQEFQRAAGNCSDENEYIQMTVEEFGRTCLETQTACTLTMTTHTTFRGFVNAAMEFVQQYNHS